MVRAYIFILIVLLAPTVVAETPPSDQSSPVEKPRTFMDVQQRMELYDAQKKNVGAAVGYSLLLPGLGNVYTEQYFIAAIAMSLTVFAAVFAGYAITTDQPQFFIWSAVSFGVGSIGGLTTSILGVRAYNYELRQRLKIPEENANRLGIQAPHQAGMLNRFPMLSWSISF